MPCTGMRSRVAIEMWKCCHHKLKNNKLDFTLKREVLCSVVANLNAANEDSAMKHVQ